MISAEDIKSLKGTFTMKTTDKNYGNSLELLGAHKRVLELMANNRPLFKILDRIVELIENFAPGARAALYFVKDGKLHLGSAKSFPLAFTSVVDGCPIGINLGVCGTAGITGQRTISTDVETDEVWGTFTDWILSFGIRSAFSTPVLSKSGAVLATVSLYYETKHAPNEWDFEIVEVAANLMSIAVERMNQESLIKEQSLKLVTSSRLAALGEMAANLAHEINNPLAIIQSHASLMKLLSSRAALSSSDVERSASHIEKTVERIAAIMKGLKIISKDGDNDPFQTVSAQNLVEDTLSFCKERLRKNGIDLRVAEISPELSIACRPVQLSQALLNLLNNAFDAVMPLQTKWISVEAKATGENCIISVADSGPGIPPELKKKIMEPFFTTKGNEHGTGLGLSISSKIIEAHSGTLHINDQVQNTQFDIHLPLDNLK